jgi:hypothetical protein
MTAITAELHENLEYNGYTGLYHNQETIVQPPGNIRAVEESDTPLMGGAYTYAPDVSVPALREIDGVFLEGWFADYYNRIVVTPSHIDLKTLTSEITEGFYIWNAYLNSSNTLSSVTTENTSGISLSGLTPPVSFNPLQELLYQVKVSLNGPSLIDAVYGFVFTVMTPELSITGQRLVTWHFAPSDKISETLEWKTDVQPAYDAEQRIALREVPRQSFKYDFLMDEFDFSLAKAIAHKWGANLYGVPVWSELTRYGSIAEGDLVLNMDTTMAEYYVDGFVFIKDANNNQTLQIIGLTAGQIQFEYPLMAFENALVMPLKKGNVKQGVTFKRSETRYTPVSCEFLIVNVNMIVPVAGGLNYPLYLGDDVATDKQFTVGDIGEHIIQSVDVFDNGSGQIVLEKQFEHIRNKKTITFLSQTMQDKWNIKAWLYTKKGKQKRFWVISWNRDIIPIADLIASEQAIRCQYMHYSRYRGVTHIAIVKTDGTILFNKILNGSELDSNEVLALDTALTADILLSDIDRICFMTKVRFDSDKIKIDHDPAPMIAKSIIPVVEVRN